MEATSLLNISDLCLDVQLDDGIGRALDRVTLQIKQGESLGIVGESGCGKSLTALSVMNLLDSNLHIASGSITFEARDMQKLDRNTIRKMRGDEIAMIFQEPMTSLNPVFTIGHQLVEAITLHRDMNRKEARKTAIQVLDEVGIPSPKSRLKQYPHNLSGGMRQRVMIAMALSCEPKLLIADEPTTALDVTIQAQILRLMRNLQQRRKMGMMFITHDLGVVAAMCERVIVMYGGQVVENASVRTIFKEPLHPYTKGLISSIPLVEGIIPDTLPTIQGRVPSLLNMQSGCRFEPRCDQASAICKQKKPPVFQGGSTHHEVACWLYENTREGLSHDNQ